MPNITPTARYYPRLSEVITVDDLPEFLSFVQNGLNAIFDKIHYKNLQYSKSQRGDSAFYSLEIVSSQKLAIPLPFDLALVLNPDLTGGDSTISSFPITLEYQWEILAFLKTFNVDNFSFSLEDFYSLGLQVFRISDEQVMAHIINYFVVPDYDTVTKFEQVVNDVNNYLIAKDPGSILVQLPPNPSIITVIAAIKANPGIDKTISLLLFAVYVLDSNPDITKTNLQKFYAILVPEGIEAYIRKIITPKAKATLSLSAAIEFPETIFKPVHADGSAITTGEKTKFVFAQAQLYADTEAGIGYQLEMGGSLLPPYAAIGKTGLIIQIESLKLDLSKKTNIPEAIADGRPDDFVGVYARAISVAFPPKWFHEDTNTPAGTATTLRLGAYDFLVGTGGVSGTIMLETVPVVTAGKISYFREAFALRYPVTLYHQNTDTKEVEEISVPDVDQLETYLYPVTTDPNKPITPYTFKFPISLRTATGEEKTFTAIADYQLFLSSLGATDVLWKTVGSSSGFRVGFREFDITLKQNKFVSSNIKGVLEIDKFVQPGTNQKVRVEVSGHLEDTGNFNLTASFDKPYPITFPDVFTYHMKSAELGTDNGVYIGTSGTIEFQGFIKEVLNLKEIELNRLRIYSNGSIELDGGSIILVKPIVMPLGPVDITVSAIHMGSYQKEYSGVMRKFQYFGFDGGISVDPFGVEIRGDGVKYYYCTDSLERHIEPFLRIETIYLDITIPAKDAVATINGWLTIPEPGVSKTYEGGVKLGIPSANLTGAANISLTPKYPAFIVDADIEFTVPIPLGSFAIYGFSGLIGYRYVAEKEAIGLVSGKDSWYDYYRAPQRGINIKKFSGPEQTADMDTPISLGAGASFGTSFDNGTVLNIKAMALLSVPSMFMIDGRAALISARLELEDTKDPPFFAYVIMGDESIEFGFGADFKMPTKSGNILSLYGNVDAAFYFNNSSKWHVNIGTKTEPISARIVTLITLRSYVMLSAKGIEAGARGDFDFKRKYGLIKVHAWAYVEIGGKISFGRPQFGAYLMAGVGADIDIKFLSFDLSVNILFGVEAPQPFRIYGKFYYQVRIRILWVFKFSFHGDLEVSWEFDKYVNREPINPLINAENKTPVKNLVTGVNMLSNETFDLDYYPNGVGLNEFPATILRKILPIDTYIDIKTEKGLLPGKIANIIGGYSNPAGNYTDLVPPERIVKGNVIRQVKHQYSIETLQIKAWSDGQWKDYNPYKALYPANSPLLNTLKIGQFQKTDNQYNAVRLLATTPFSFTEQGQPGWHTPEQYGVTASSLFCEGQEIEMRAADFVNKPLGQDYYCYTPNELFYSNQVAFLLIDRFNNDKASVTDETNVFNKEQSLTFNNSNKLQIILPQPSVHIELSLTSFAQGVKLKFYAPLINDAVSYITYGNPDPLADNPDQPFEVVLDAGALGDAFVYLEADWKAVVKVVIEPLYPDAVTQRVDFIEEQIATITEANNAILLGITEGELQSTAELEAELHVLLCSDRIVKSKPYRFDSEDNLFSLYENNDAEEWLTSWDYATDSKFSYNELGFKLDGSITVESNSPILDIKLLPIEQYGTDEVLVMEYYVQYQNKKAFIIITDVENYLDYFDVVVTYYADPESEYGAKTFINRYDKNDLQNYNYSEEFIEYDRSFVFSIGKYKNEALISKVAVNGDLLWECTYQIAGQGGNPLVFHKIIQLDKKQGTADEYPSAFYNYIVYASAGNKHYILSIYSGSGGTIWGKQVLDAPNYLLLIEPSKTEYGFYIASTSTGTGIQQDTIFGKVNSDGIFIQGSHRPAADGSIYRFTDIHSDANGVAFSGTFMAENQPVGIILKMGQNLGGIDSLYISERATILHSVRTLSGRRFLVSGYDYDSGAVFVSLVHLKTTTSYYTFPNTTDHKSVIQLYNDGFYLLHYNGENGILHQLDWDFNVLWTKEISLPDGNGINDFTFNTVSEKLTFNALHSTLGSVIGHTNKELRSCLTNILPTVQPEEQSFRVDSWETGSVAAGMSFSPVSFIINSLTSGKIELCPTVEDDGCTPDELICNLRIEIMTIYSNCFQDPEIVAQTLNFNQIKCAQDIRDLIRLFGSENPDYNLWVTLQNYVGIINAFISQSNIDTYTAAYYAIQSIIDYLDTLGDCSCECSDNPKFHTLLHEVKWLSIEDYQYNINIPGQQAIQNDYQAAIAGITQFIQPVWRPDTSYLVHFELRDSVDENSAKSKTYPYTYGFTTAGPLGFFHTNQYADYGDPEHPETSPLTSLKSYIDYNRSYPSADGNLLSAKPLFYNDDTTEISLFFNKTYATHFFKKWQAYNGLKQLDGRLKIVIKDPREDISITNPPSLDIDTTITTVPQTIEVWHSDTNPQVPQVINQYMGLFDASICTGSVAITAPASEYMVATPKYLKPNKLYTAIVNTMFDVNHNGVLENTPEETHEVHRFVFKTSRYENFKSQINSYLLKENVDDLIGKPAVFSVKKSFTAELVQAAYQTVVGQPITGLPALTLENLQKNYQHPYDRLFEGIFGFSPWDDSISTEFNVIRNMDDNKIIAVIVRNPEPFNNPKFPMDILKDTLQVLSGTVADSSYKVLFSKDYSQAIIMHSSKAITENLDLKFTYKLWNGSRYYIAGTNPVTNVVTNAAAGTVVIHDLEILNN